MTTLSAVQNAILHAAEPMELDGRISLTFIDQDGNKRPTNVAKVFVERLLAALHSAPVQPIAQGEREAFEAWALSQEYVVKRGETGEYQYGHNQTRWEAWQARAAVSQDRPAQDSAQDAARFDWYFGTAAKDDFMNTYLRGMMEGWTVDQWRAAIDAAIDASLQGKEVK